MFQNLFLSKGKLGEMGDSECYKIAHDFLRNRAPIFALKEAIALDYAAAQHTNWMNTANTDSHFQSDGSSPMSRVPAFGNLLVNAN